MKHNIQVSSRYHLGSIQAIIQVSSMCDLSIIQVFPRCHPGAIYVSSRFYLGVIQVLSKWHIVNVNGICNFIMNGTLQQSTQSKGAVFTLGNFEQLFSVNSTQLRATIKCKLQATSRNYKVQTSGNFTVKTISNFEQLCTVNC